MLNKSNTENNFLNMIIEIGKAAEAQMEKAETKEDYAFLLGHVNMAAAISSGILNSKSNARVIQINFNFKEAKQAYEEAKEQTQEYHQMSLDELFPELMKLLKQINDKKE